MRIDRVTLKLFTPFPREVGNPARRVVKNLKQFKNFIEINNGKKDCLVALYPVDLRVDKLWFDFDGAGAYEDFKRAYLYCLEMGYSAIPVASGKKGYHLYILIRPGYHDKKTLRNATLSLAQNFNTNGSLDLQVIGDIRRLSRIPNTLRPPENKTYCVYLPPDFYKMSEREINALLSSPQIYDYDSRNPPRIDELITEDFDETECRCKVSSNGQPPLPIPKDLDAFLKLTLRPCLYKRIKQPEPPHVVRVAATLDYLNAGLNPEEIQSIYERIGWVDYDPEITDYQIRSLIGLKPYSCRKLRGLLNPKCCEG